MRIDTQNRKVLQYLRNNRGGMTARDGYIFGIDRLSARIFDLREDGHIIDTEREPNADGIGSHGRYFLVKENSNSKYLKEKE